MSTQVIVAAAVAGIGAYAFYVRNTKVDNSKPTFGSFGFHSLKLESGELINHNTKKLRFELPNKELPAGLKLSSALLTLSFPNGEWKPCIRPYTPTNSLGK